jgi:lipid A ethanolaminephosphotransferase
MPDSAKPFRPALGAGVVLLLVVAYLVIVLNARFWGIVSASPGLNGLHGMKVVAAVAAALFALTLLMLLPLSLRWTFRPGLAAVLLLSATAAFFIGDYGAVIDRHALASVYATDAREAGEWLSPRMLAFIAGFGMLPAAMLWWVRIDWRSAPRELWSRMKLGALAFALLAVAAGIAGKDVASLLRNRMELRHIANPFALLAANLSYLEHARDIDRPFVRIATDARRAATLAPSPRPVVLVLAIGESLRAASLDLNGYDRDTDVDLHPLPIVNFGQVGSCGTNTATSLPCMFSDLGRAAYDDAEAKHRENLLDVLMRGGYDVLWIDNNTGSKGLAARAREISASAGADPARCNPDGCHDEVLVDRLKAVLPTIRRDTVIVMHLLGSHGPAYHARYPATFSVFQPECRTNALQDCSDAQLRNTYDNSVLYTTHVLAGIASLLGETRASLDRMPAEALRCRALRGHAGSGACPPLPQASTAPAADPGIDAAMLFVSDHGESLGEKGLYLHGAPYAIAPDEQTRVPMLLWASERFAVRRRLDLDCLRRIADRPLSHDYFFHSVLALADVRTRARKPALDFFAGCLPPR